MKSIVHIGLHKTGSTSIQRALTRYRNELSAVGITYPRTGTGQGRDEHNQLAHALLDGEIVRAEGLLESMKSEAGQNSSSLMIISSEHMSSLNDAAISVIAEGLVDTRVVVYLRNPCDWLRSLLFQQIKHSTPRRIKWSGSVDSFVNEHLPACDYFSLCSRWAAIFGWNNLTIRVFENAVSSGRLVSDFSEAAGIPRGILPATIQIHENESLSIKATRALLLLNRVEESLPPQIAATRIWRRLDRSARHDSILSRVVDALPYSLIEDVKFSSGQLARIEQASQPNKHLERHVAEPESVRHLYQCRNQN